jgi:hypothetical protein
MSAEVAAQEICAGPSDLDFFSLAIQTSRAGLFTAGASRLPAVRLVVKILAFRKGFERE